MARILLIDDDRPLVDSMLRAFRLRGIEATVAYSFQEGRSLFAADAFDLLVSDQELGDGHGTELLAELRAIDPRPRTILVSGSWTEAERASLQASGAADLVCIKGLGFIGTLFDEIAALPA